MRHSLFSIRQHLVLLLIVMLVGSGVVYVIIDKLDKNAIEKREAQLLSVNRRAAFEFSESLDKFIYLMSGIRTYVNHAEKFPTQDELIAYVEKQREDLSYSDSLIISYIDQDHVFRYLFTQTAVDPANLIGTSVRAIRSEAAVRRLDKVMEDEKFHMFPVTNLVEGWVGLPLDFNVLRNGTSIGYVAAIADFKSIIEPIYTFEPSDEFVFRFSVNDTEFDRERAYDRTKIYHDRVDPKYFRNYSVDDDDYIYSELTLYGLNFKIGTAYINEYQKSENLNLLIYSWFIMFVGFGIYSLVRLIRFKQLTSSLQESIDTIEFQKTKLDIQNAELNKLNRTKDKFFSIIGHDLKGPLTSIASIVDLWNTKSIKPEQTNDLMMKLGQASRSASRLLENLLQWSLVNTGQIKWNPEEVSINELVSEVFGQLGATASAKGIKFSEKVDAGLSIVGDRNMLSTIVRNLVSNAIKFAKEDTKVDIRATKKGNKVVLEISDKGAGLDSQDQEALFSFTKNPNVSSEGGTGLGLVLVKEFVDRHKGVINVQSEKDVGTTFVLEFPAD